MRRVVIRLDFLSDFDDDVRFGAAVLCAIERSPEFATDEDGTLRLVPRSTVSARDDYHPNEWNKSQMIEAMWAEIDTLRSALRYLNEWCPSKPPRQAEIDRLLAAPRLPGRSLLQLRARLEMSRTAAIMDQLVVDE